MADRLTRKDMKQDELATAATRAADWLEAHAHKLIRGAVAVGVLALLVAGFFYHRQARQERAAALLAEALRVYEAPVVENGAAPDDPRNPSFESESQRLERARELFEQVYGDYSRTRPGDLASLFLARMALDQGNAARAEELWDRFLERRDGHMLATAVYLNVIGLKREQGRAEEVVEDLRAELAGGRRTVPEDVLLWELAMTLRALDREEEAVAPLQRLVDEFPRSPFAAEARQHLGDAPAPRPVRQPTQPF